MSLEIQYTKTYTLDRVTGVARRAVHAQSLCDVTHGVRIKTRYNGFLCFCAHITVVVIIYSCSLDYPTTCVDRCLETRHNSRVSVSYA